MNRRSLLAATIALPFVLGLPAFAQDAQPFAGKAISVLLPPWGTLPKEMTDRFVAETGIALETQTLGWDDIRTKIVTSMVAGTAPANATEVDWSWVGQFGSAGWYAPLSGKVDPALLADLPTAKIFQFDGELLAVPYNNDFRILILNRDHLTRAGIKDAPKTPQELLDAAKAIKAAGIAEFPIGLPLSATEGSATAWYLLTKAFGGELFDAAFEPQFTAPDSAGYKAMAFEVEALKAGLIDPASTGLKDVEIQELFKSGRISFDVAGWAGNVAVYSDKAKSQVSDHVEAALLPSTTGTSRTFGLPGAVGIPVSAADPEAGLAFIEWLLKPENQIQSYTALGNLPTRTSVLEKLNAEGKLASGTALLQQAALVEPLFQQGTPGWYPEFSSAVATYLNQAAKGQITVAEAVAQIATEAKNAQQ
ncbi:MULTISPECIES: extracellular solute-binding protein [unclassified Aureimonas]|uniref:extracellular solute-binding protein n=1 Tax=unclassified Aureimonas TaxID=2615206 RepID=UPI0006F60625|nr:MULTISPECIES: extracellular solute-binding protein [unclassified Aureimonas]KQT65772.1 ABC transporter substrate-binding protein [Aureimonas sp. Leaf427]KQT74772.1 ABC transporter substrate-binding protein [Aureimonas sp. Leaf460]